GVPDHDAFGERLLCGAMLDFRDFRAVGMAWMLAVKISHMIVRFVRDVPASTSFITRMPLLTSFLEFTYGTSLTTNSRCGCRGRIPRPAVASGPGYDLVVCVTSKIMPFFILTLPPG